MRQEQIVEVLLKKLLFRVYCSNSYFNSNITRSHDFNEIQGRVTQWVRLLQ